MYRGWRLLTCMKKQRRKAEVKRFMVSKEAGIGSTECLPAEMVGPTCAFNKSPAIGRRKMRWLEQWKNLSGTVRGLLKFMSAVDPVARDFSAQTTGSSHPSPHTVPSGNTLLPEMRASTSKQEAAGTEIQFDAPRPSPLQRPQQPIPLGRLTAFAQNLCSMFKGILREGSSGKCQRDRDAGPGTQGKPAADTSYDGTDHQLDLCRRASLGTDSAGVGAIAELIEPHHCSNVIAVCEDLPSGGRESQ